jgi:hypothetical protein
LRRHHREEEEMNMGIQKPKAGRKLEVLNPAEFQK